MYTILSVFAPIVSMIVLFAITYIIAVAVL